jgi:hypothetical protein
MDLTSWCELEFVALFKSVLEYNWNEQPQLEGLWLIRLLDKYLILTMCCIHGIGD